MHNTWEKWDKLLLFDFYLFIALNINGHVVDTLVAIALVNLCALVGHCVRELMEEEWLPL